jgi:hypothetical protein
MKRLLAIGLVITFGNASVLLAGEPFVVSAARLATAMNASQAVSQPKADRPLGVVSFAVAAGVREPALAAQQGGSLSAAGGLSKRSKAMIYLGVAAAFLGVAYGIDHNVKDVTPSTLGTRADESVFGK